MPTDHRSPEEIERDIERERSELKGTISDIQDRFSVDGVVREVSEQLREHGGEIGRSLSRSVRDNPTALALTGIGLAWLIFGNERDRREPLPRRRTEQLRRDRYAQEDYGDGFGAYDDDYDDVDDAYALEPRRRTTTPVVRPVRRTPVHTGPEWARPVTPADFDDADYDDADDRGLMDGARDRASAAGSAVASGAASARDGVGNAASATGSALSSAGSSVKGAAS
ncbi:DUF3618 domain-containing protein, partial [Roseobacter sp. HKCCA0434]|uniref:DUF3618 domain-containing protein n=1 Tax=Roseobacter sp. HKCCA0434 TaxID=3079297 RepID=UPI00290593CF